MGKTEMQTPLKEIAEQATLNGNFDADEFGMLIIRDVVTQIKAIAYKNRHRYMGNDPPVGNYIWGIAKHYGVKV